MAAYSQFLGAAVKVHYRLGDILLSASGTFVADSGRSIFLEQHVEQRGKLSCFRWEIPYRCIHRIEPVVQIANAETSGDLSPSTSFPKVAAASAGARGVVSQESAVVPFPQSEETA